MSEGQTREIPAPPAPSSSEIIERIGLGLYVCKIEDEKGRPTLRCVMANPASTQLTGIPADQVVGRTMDDMFPDWSSGGLVAAALRACETGAQVEVEELKDSPQGTIPDDWTFSVFPIPDAHVGVSFQNVTGRRRAERKTIQLLGELAQSGRINAMSEIASGLAHELNQPLAAIVAYVDACQELIESGRMGDRHLSDVLRAVSGQAERAGRIIHRLRQMIRRRPPVRSAININDAVGEIVGLLDDELRQSSITLVLAPEADTPLVWADFQQVQQIVLHLMRNAIEALGEVAAERRRLTVSTRRTPAAEAEVSIADCGLGLTDAEQERLFEPFYTTKAQGLGLGLAIARTIVQAHGGKIWLAANPEGGATARFTLPAEGRSA